MITIIFGILFIICLAIFIFTNPLRLINGISLTFAMIFFLSFLASLMIERQNNNLANAANTKLEYLIDNNKNIDSITIYKNHGGYDIDINNISYDNLSEDSMKLAIYLYPKSIYKP